MRPILIALPTLLLYKSVLTILPTSSQQKYVLANDPTTLEELSVTRCQSMLLTRKFNRIRCAAHCQHVKHCKLFSLSSTHCTLCGYCIKSPAAELPNGSIYLKKRGKSRLHEIVIGHKYYHLNHIDFELFCFKVLVVKMTTMTMTLAMMTSMAMSMTEG